MRVIPRHIWEPVPRSDWAADTAMARVVGSGPYRLERWERGQFLTLAADSAAAERPGIRRAIWRFTPDPDAALNLVLSHEADLLETAIGPERAQRAGADTTLRLIAYPSAAYGFLGFNLYDHRRQGPHPLLGDRATRRGLAMGVDRSVLGPVGLRHRGPGSAGSDVSPALDLERQHPRPALRHGGGGQDFECGGMAGA